MSKSGTVATLGTFISTDKDEVIGKFP